LRLCVAIFLSLRFLPQGTLYSLTVQVSSESITREGREGQPLRAWIIKEIINSFRVNTNVIIDKPGIGCIMKRVNLQTKLIIYGGKK
jgi:hypothetical protein